MSDIFISYEKSDLPRAEMLVRSLRACGWTTFWDRTIPAGGTWRKTIGVELDGARCVVVLWSRASMESRWVHEEADDALSRNILVPVLIENIQPPLGFRSIQAGNLANWDGKESAAGFQKLITDITGLIGPGRPARSEEIASAPARPLSGSKAAPAASADLGRKIEDVQGKLSKDIPAILGFRDFEVLDQIKWFGCFGLVIFGSLYGSEALERTLGLRQKPGLGLAIFLTLGILSFFIVILKRSTTNLLWPMVLLPLGIVSLGMTWSYSAILYKLLK
jgi:hypothetical protein